VSRGEMPAGLFVNDLLVTMNVKIKLHNNDVVDLNASDVNILDPKVFKGIKEILALEVTK
jgi:hypothetical protein